MCNASRLRVGILLSAPTNCRVRYHLLTKLLPPDRLAFDSALSVDGGHDLRPRELERVLYRGQG